MTATNLISITAAVVAALAAGLAWFMAHRTRALTTYYQINSSLIELNQIFIDSPELRPYFMEGGKLPKGQEQKAKALASLILNTFEAICSQKITLGEVEHASWKGYITHQIKSVKIVNDAYQTEKEWYPNITAMIS
ncbi:MAG: hypothetical protein WDN66_03710 [Candidatus Saccharibacteria bacterium]